MKTHSISTDELVELAWADDVSFDVIKDQTGMSEAEVIRVMQSALKPSSFRLWRKRVSGRKSKHAKKMRPHEQPGDRFIQ